MLSRDEEQNLADLWRDLRLIRNMAWSLVFLSFVFQIRFLVPWERRFTTVIHGLILLGWNAGLLPLSFTAFIASSSFSWCKSARDLLHNLQFVVGRTRGFISGICTWQF